jgi:DNA-binding NarL/FixJ family response regulator
MASLYRLRSVPIESPEVEGGAAWRSRTSSRPGGGGEAILLEIRRNRSRTRVAVCSGLDDPSRLDRVRKLGPDLMLWKPVEMAPLYQLCEAAMAASA